MTKKSKKKNRKSGNVTDARVTGPELPQLWPQRELLKLPWLQKRHLPELQTGACANLLTSELTSSVGAERDPSATAATAATGAAMAAEATVARAADRSLCKPPD